MASLLSSFSLPTQPLTSKILHSGPGLTNGPSLLAANERAAFIGRVWFPARTGTKVIARVGFPWDLVVKSGGSGLTLSLQDVSTTAYVPDLTQDQTVAIANGDAGFVSNAWYTTGLLSGGRTVTFGELLSVVLEWDGSGRQGSDTAATAAVLQSGTGVHFTAAGARRSGAGTWTHDVNLPTVVLYFTDGTFGTLYGSFPCAAFTQRSIASDSAEWTEYGMQLGFSRDRYVDGLEFQCDPDTTAADFEVVLYGPDGAVLTTTTRDAHHLTATPTTRAAVALFDGAQLFTAQQLYTVVIKALASSPVVISEVTVAEAGHWSLHAGGSGWKTVYRLGAGAWVTEAMQRPLMWPLIGGL